MLQICWSLRLVFVAGLVVDSIVDAGLRGLPPPLHEGRALPLYVSAGLQNTGNQT